MKSTLQINFSDGSGNTVARLTIASSNSGTVGENLEEFIPYDDVIIDSKNAEWIQFPGEIDNYSLIQVLSKEDSSLPRILLLEETDYQIRIERLSADLDNSRELEYLLTNGDSVQCDKSLFDDDDQKICYYSLRSKSYVGKCFFNIFHKSEEIRIPFEIRSKKLNYNEEYPVMLKDVSEFYTSVLFQLDSPVFSDYALDEKNDVSLYENFMVLNYLFGNMGIRSIFEHISMNKNLDLRAEYEEKPAGMISFMDPPAINYSLRNCNVSLNKGNILFQNAIESNYVENEDTPENRLVKELFNRILDLLLMLKKTVENDSKHLENTYLDDSLDDMIDQTQEILSTSWLKNVGNLTRVPYNSSVLQNKYGYREMFIAYQMLGMGTSAPNSLVEELLEGHNKKVFQIYEYWCYIQLFKSLQELSVDPLKFPLKTSSNKLEVSPKRQNDLLFKINHDGREILIKLLYNKEFNKNSQHYTSYSLELRPDFSLYIELPPELGGTSHIINFDAKYRTTNVSKNKDSQFYDCLDDDIHKMHTYRDALLKSHGSYVFYPGTQRHYFERDGENTVLPSVGAIPLCPGKDNDRTIVSLLKKILDKIIEDSKSD